MTLELLIEYLAIFIWILPAIRNYKSDLRFYFFILAIASPASELLYKLTDFYPLVFLSIFRLLQYFSLKNATKIKTNTKIDILTAIITLGAIISFPNQPAVAIILISAIILTIFIRELINVWFNYSSFNISLLVLIFYELLLIIPFMYLMLYTELSIILFYGTSVFQFFIAIFFTIFREDNSLLHVKLKGAKVG